MSNLENLILVSSLIYSIFWLFNYAEITEWFRTPILKEFNLLKTRTVFPPKTAKDAWILVKYTVHYWCFCPYCLGFWVALPFRGITEALIVALFALVWHLLLSFLNQKGTVIRF